MAFPHLVPTLRAWALLFQTKSPPIRIDGTRMGLLLPLGSSTSRAWLNFTVTPGPCRSDVDLLREFQKV